jgi:hypothetical protein
MPFVKGDPRINRKGRPKSFDKLRALAIMIANEEGGKDDKGNPLTNVEFALRKLMKSDTKLFLEIAFGKVPDKLEISDTSIIVKLKQDES